MCLTLELGEARRLLGHRKLATTSVYTRVTPLDLQEVFARAHPREKKLPEEIQTLFSSRPLTLAEVHAALAYHYDHPEELEDYLRRSKEVEREFETKRAEYLRRRAGK